MQTLLRYIALVLASMLLPAAVGIAGGVSASRSQYAPLDDPGPAPPAATPQTHDPDRPTAVVVLGANGGQVSDVLAPYEILVTAEAFNVYTAAPERRPLPLTGGLHLIPDLTFGELDARLGAGNAADVVIVPRLPDGGEPSTEPVTDWLRQQAAAGALMVSVCDGARVLASTGLLDGRVATSHWARLGGLERDYPDVRWVRGTRYVDDGDVITSAGLLSSIDGTLRVVERLAGPEVASRTADAVDWGYYSPGAPASMPASRRGPDAVLRPLNAAYRRARLGVLLTEGVGEIELASVFDTYSGQSFANHTVAVAATDDPVSSRNGLTFVPSSDLHSVGDELDRLVVPGSEAARQPDPDLAAHALHEHDLTPEYIHDAAGFPFEAPLRDLARTTDLPTARWTAKLLEYPTDDLRLAGPAWPWPILLLPLLLLLTNAAVIAGLARVLRPRRGDPPPAARPAPEVTPHLKTPARDG